MMYNIPFTDQDLWRYRTLKTPEQVKLKVIAGRKKSYLRKYHALKTPKQANFIVTVGRKHDKGGTHRNEVKSK